MSNHNEAKDQRELRCIAFIQSQLISFKWERPLGHSSHSFPDFLVEWKGIEYYGEHVEASGIQFERPIVDRLDFDCGTGYVCCMPRSFSEQKGAANRWQKFARKAISKGYKAIDFHKMGDDAALKLFAEIQGVPEDNFQGQSLYYHEFTDFALLSYPLSDPKEISSLQITANPSNDGKPIRKKKDVFEKIRDEILKGVRPNKKIMLILDSILGWDPLIADFEWADAVLLNKADREVKILKEP